jgi:gluconokinase
MSGTSIILVMGVSGSGKSTIAEQLAQKLGLPFLEGDDFHSDAAKAKMAAGTPLTDDDRWPWLDRLNQAARQYQDKGAVIACSALRHVYRDRLFAGIPDHKVVYLKGDHDVIAQRIEQRKNHYMPEKLLDSQFATLEEPGLDEHAIVVSIHATPEETLADVMAKLDNKS